MPLRLRSPAALLSFALATSATAAEPPDIGEITVTIRKIEERLVDVPLAVTKFDAEEIERAGIRSLEDVAALTPGVTFSNVLGEVLPAPVIRGLAPTAIFQENNAAIFVDGIYISGREGLNFSQLDLETIEVVKGPVSALYGRNAFSGAIVYTTARPTPEVTGRGELQYGTDDRQSGKLSVSGPIAGETLMGRAAVLYDSWDGSYENQGGGDDLGGYEYRTFQGSLLFAPRDGIEALLGVYVSDDEIGAPAMTSVVMNCEDRNLVNPESFGFVNFCGELPPADEDSLTVLDSASGEERDLERAHLNLSFDLGGGTLSALSGYSHVEQSFVEDASRSGGANQVLAYQATPFAPMAPGFLQTFEAGLLQLQPQNETRELSQEIRFTSALERPLRYVAGLHYYRTDTDTGGQGIASTTPLPADFFSFCPCVPTGGGTGFSLGFADAAMLPWFSGPSGDSLDSIVIAEETEATAVFGSLEYDFSGRWTGRAELRYTNEDRSHVNRGVVPGTADDFSGEDSWDLLTWRTQLRYKPHEDAEMWATIATGEKSGGFDSVINVILLPPAGPPIGPISVGESFEPERNVTYELGGRAQSSDGRLLGDLAIFHIDWSDVLIPQVFTDVDGVPVAQPYSLDVKPGDASVYGAELSLSALLGAGWRVQLGASWTNAEYDEAVVETFAEFPSFAPDGDISGNEVLRQSPWKANLAVDYHGTLSERLDWYLRGDVLYQDRQFADASNQTVVPDHTWVNARLGIVSGRYTIEAWGLNVFDDDSPTAAFRDVFFTNSLPDARFPVGAFFPFRYSVAQPRLRQFGLTVRVRF